MPDGRIELEPLPETLPDCGVLPVPLLNGYVGLILVAEPAFEKGWVDVTPTPDDEPEGLPPGDEG